MNLQFEQLVWFLVLVTMCIAFYKVKNWYFRGALIFIMFVVFTMQPLKFKQEGMSKIERRDLEVFTGLPERIYVDEKSFEEKQKTQMNELKKQSKERMNEIN